jgi:hypothetical protein
VAPDLALADIPAEKIPNRYSRPIVFAFEDEVPGALKGLTQLQRHLCWMARIQHPRIARPRAMLISPLTLMMEGTGVGMLRDLMFPPPEGKPISDLLSWKSRVQIALDVASAMAALHEHAVMNPLLCSSSVLVCPSDDWGNTLRGKLCGLGPRVCGSRSVEDCAFWASLLNNEPNSIYFDSFLFGTILYEMIMMEEARTHVEFSGKPLGPKLVEEMRTDVERMLKTLEGKVLHGESASVLILMATRTLRAEPSRRESFLKMLGVVPGAQVEGGGGGNSITAIQPQPVAAVPRKTSQPQLGVVQRSTSPPTGRPPSMVLTRGQSTQALPLGQTPSSLNLAVQNPLSNSSPNLQPLSPGGSTYSPTGSGQSPPSSTSTVGSPPPTPSGPSFDAIVAGVIADPSHTFNCTTVADNGTLWLGSQQNVVSIHTLPVLTHDVYLPMSQQSDLDATGTGISITCILESGSVVWTATNTGEIRWW